MVEGGFKDEHPEVAAGSLFGRKQIGDLAEEAKGSQLHRTLGPFNLISLGIGAIIGAGLFSLTGLAAADNAGPAVVISFVIAAVGCAFAGMCYSELSSMIPVAGSAYTYAVIFFAYIGFDAVSTAAQETKNPQRDMPIGILGSLVICTILYIAFGFVLTGLVNYKDMHGDARPVVTAIDQTPFHWLKIATTLGVIGGFTTVMLVMLLGQSRVFYSMSNDGLLPKVLSIVHPAWKTPWLSNVIFMIATGLLGGFVPIDILGHMTSIGTLLAFIIVCAGVIVLRKTHPELHRAYRTPFVPFVPIAGILVCLTMMASLGIYTWLRLVAWLLAGMVIFFTFSRSHSQAARRAAARAAVKQ